MFCVDLLRDTTPHLIDVTIGYKGTKPGQIPSKLYNLKSIFLDGRGPPEVHMHVRKIPIKDVPRDEKAFVDWTMKLCVRMRGRCAGSCVGKGDAHAS